jgi:flagellar biosynthesis/type III secretory pathway protein FliH
MIAKTDREIREAVDLLYELSADEVVRAEYDRQQKAMMDHLTLMEDSYLDGKEAGIAIGEAKGIAIGKEAGIAIGEAKGMQKKQMEMLETMNQAESLEDFMRLREQLRTTLGNTQSIQP